MISLMDSYFSSFWHLSTSWPAASQVLWGDCLLPLETFCPAFQHGLQVGSTDSPSELNGDPGGGKGVLQPQLMLFRLRRLSFWPPGVCFSQAVWWLCLEPLWFTLLDCILFWMFPWPCQSPALWRCVNVSHSPCLHSRPGVQDEHLDRLWPPRGAYLAGAPENSLVAQTVKDLQQCRRPRFRLEKP